MRRPWGGNGPTDEDDNSVLLPRARPPCRHDAMFAGEAADVLAAALERSRDVFLRDAGSARGGDGEPFGRLDAFPVSCEFPQPL